MTAPKSADKLDAATLRYAAEIAAGLNRAGDPGEIEETLLRLASSLPAPVPELGKRNEPVTQDGPHGGWTTVGQSANELDFILTQFETAVEAATEDSAMPEEAEHQLALAHKLKREIIEKYTPRSGCGTRWPDGQPRYTPEEIDLLCDKYIADTNPSLLPMNTHGHIREALQTILRRELRTPVSATGSNEGYPGIAHDLETARSLLAEVSKDRQLSGEVHTSDLLWRSPATALREQAEKLERDDDLTMRIRSFVSATQPFNQEKK